MQPDVRLGYTDVLVVREIDVVRCGAEGPWFETDHL